MLREIEDGRITEAWYKDERTSAANKLARILYGEQDAVLYNQVECFYAIVNRLFHEKSFMEVGGKTFPNVITAGGQFTTYYFRNDDTRNSVLAAKDDVDLWENAKLLACYATVLFGDKTKVELIEEYREETGNSEGTAEDARAYYMEKLGAMPDAYGLPIGFFITEHTFFMGGSAAVEVVYSDGSSRDVNYLYTRYDPPKEKDEEEMR